MKKILVIIAVILIVAGGYFLFTGDPVEKPTKEGEEVAPSVVEGYSILSSFEAPRRAGGITWDGSNFWMTADDHSIYKLDAEGEVIYVDNVLGQAVELKALAPGGLANGITWDGEHFWFADGKIFGDGTIYKLKIETEEARLSIDRIFSFDLPEMDGYGEAIGVTVGDDSIWVSYTNGAGEIDDMIYEFDMEGNILSEFQSPGSQPSGLAWDGEYLWNGNTGSAPDLGTIYKLDTSGNVIAEFEAPDPWPGGMEWIGDSLWVVGSNKSIVYELEIE